eukprot:TRINITY_DN42661_c0_g1_i1.p1 TRINITY_DN42661_c0_g1~~TRINITY_DN42661_c0_g1_i1.p1  ORF type:complete len:601 (+),score=129.02 TRINITY_DN42661_c0_g1_i1:35-1804(+)
MVQHLIALLLVAASEGQLLSQLQGAAAAGSDHAVFLRQDGTAVCTGQNAWGQFGINSWTTTGRPTQILTKNGSVLSGIGAVFARGFFTAVVLQDGRAFGTGLSALLPSGASSGNLEALVPELVVKSLALGRAHALFLTQAGEAFALGSNDRGQLGINSTTSASEPRLVMTGVKAVAAGDEHSIFLKEDGSVLAAGDRRYGQLGDGMASEEAQLLPTQVLQGETVEVVAAGPWHSIFVLSNGTAFAAGRNEDGRLGVSSGPYEARPLQVLQDVRSVAAGARHTIFLQSNGSVFAAGENLYGQLGNSSVTSFASHPVEVLQGTRSVAAGDAQSFFIQESGSLLCAGKLPEQKRHEVGMFGLLAENASEPCSTDTFSKCVRSPLLFVEEKPSTVTRRPGSTSRAPTQVETSTPMPREAMPAELQGRGVTGLVVLAVSECAPWRDDSNTAWVMAAALANVSGPQVNESMILTVESCPETTTDPRRLEHVANSDVPEHVAEQAHCAFTISPPLALASELASIESKMLASIGSLGGAISAAAAQRGWKRGYDIAVAELSVRVYLEQAQAQAVDATSRFPVTWPILLTAAFLLPCS